MGQRRDVFDTALTVATRTAYAVKETRSIVYLRLLWLTWQAPRRTAGTFSFPFGRVYYTDAFSLASMYHDIFVERVYAVAGLGNAPRILDCGGNIGLSTIWFKQRYPSARVTVFEADPAITAVLHATSTRSSCARLTWSVRR